MAVVVFQMTFRITMYDDTNVSVTYTGNVMHPVGGRWARYIRKEHRQALHPLFKYGCKPYNFRMQKLLEKPGSELLAGNFDGLGSSDSVIRKVATESHQDGRLDKDVYVSLVKFQESLSHSNCQKSSIKAFLQSISIDPIVLHFWTPNGIRLWHELCRKHNFLFDATGSVVSTKTSEKRILYYELSCPSLHSCGPSLPVAGFLSNVHTVSVISNFLQCFRDSEKRMFGFRNVQQPCLFNVDFSMALIVSLLQVFNLQTLHGYLQLCWETVTGEQCLQDSLQRKTVILVCLAHFMKCIRNQCMKLFKSGLEIVLYSVSLIAKCETMPEVEQLLYDLLTVLGSKTCCSEFWLSHKRLSYKIQKHSKTFENDVLGTDSDAAGSSSAENIQSCNIGSVDEETFLLRAEKSPFLLWGYTVYHKSTINIEASTANVTNLQANRFHCQPLLDKLLKFYIATLPLWSMLMIGDLSRHTNKTENVFSNISSQPFSRTTGSQEQRFTVIKYLTLQGRTTSRLDEFTDALYHNYVATEKSYVLMYLRKRRQPAGDKSSSIIKENWNKKLCQATQLSNPKVGKFQQPPVKKLKDLNTVNSGLSQVHSSRKCETVTAVPLSSICKKFCGIPNLGNTCWISSVLQALSGTGIAFDIDSKLIALDDEAACSVQACFRHMKLRAPEPVPAVFITKLFEHGVLALKHNVSDQLTFGVQQDAYDFLDSVVCLTCNPVQWHTSLVFSTTCKTCFNSWSEPAQKMVALFLSVPVNARKQCISLSELMMEILSEENVEGLCRKCSVDEYSLRR